MAASNKPNFTNFLFLKKYSKEYQPEPVVENYIGLLVSDVDLANTLHNHKCNASKEEQWLWMSKLEDKLDNLTPQAEDLLFSIVYSDITLTKIMKDKDFNLDKVKALYKKQFQANKKFLMLYNNPSAEGDAVKSLSELNIRTGGNGCLKGNNLGGCRQSASKSLLQKNSFVVTRFPPEPSGYLHIGHAKAALINWQLSQGVGQLIVRFDDTNPEKEKREYENSILEDLALLKIRNYRLSRSSDYFDKIYDLAVSLIEEHKAYCDNTDQEQMRNERMHGICSKCRNQSIEENLRLFNSMGEPNGYCLRAKIDMENLNKAMRDPVIFRYSSTSHHCTGTKFKLYPTYDFTCPIVDSLEGVTLSLRTNEYRDRNDQYYWFIENLKLSNRPVIKDFSRLNFENTLLSKRKLRFYIENGYVSGWDDPRLATLRGIRRLGMDFDILREYIMLQGASQKTNTISWDKVWAMNKKKVDGLAARYSCVKHENCVTVVVLGVENHSKEIPRHKKNPDLGFKGLLFTKEIFISQEDALTLALNEEVTLMNWGNAIVKSIVAEENTKVIRRMEVELNLEGDYKKTKKISWVSSNGAIKVTLCEYGNLLNDKETENIKEKFNVNSKIDEIMLAEIGVSETRIGDVIQFERIGFFYCDKDRQFNLMPFTRQKRMLN